MKPQFCFYLLWALLVIFSGLTSQARADSLIIDGTTVTLSGQFRYEKVEIINGGILFVGPYDGSAGGSLVLRARSIFVDATSAIVADGAGFRGLDNQNGEGPGGGIGGTAVFDGADGGAYGGAGGQGTRDDDQLDPVALGGNPYGSADGLDIQMGSGGGAAGAADGDFGGAGGNGGGAIALVALKIVIEGIVSTNGMPGVGSEGDASGGGSGGGILLAGLKVSLSGALSTNGGDGAEIGPGIPGDGSAGGGGGGRIKIFSITPANITGSLSVSGGLGPAGATDGGEGTVFIKGNLSADTLDKI